MNRMYVDAGSFAGMPDSAAIQAAVNEAARTDLRTVVIPATKQWQLENTVLLPDHVTVILVGCVIHSKGVAFQNANANVAAAKNLGGEQQGIRILGTQNAKIISDTQPQLLLDNVKNYAIAGISFEGGEGICLRHARYGKVQRVRFLGCKHGVLLGSASTNNVLEDIYAETLQEAVLWRADASSIWGRSADMYDSSLCRLEAVTQGAPAVAIHAGPVVCNDLILRDITDYTAGEGAAILLGEDGQMELVDISIRGVLTERTTVSVSEQCDGIYLANLQGAPAVIAEGATRVLLEEAPGLIESPCFDAELPGSVLDANDPQYRGATDAETLQNALNDAAGKWLVIPRYNARTGKMRWLLDTTVAIPSNTTVILLDAHLQQTDFTYCNMLTNARPGAREIRIWGVGSATLDTGRPNGLKRKNAGKLGFGPITDNATMYFDGVDGLEIKDLYIHQTRWYSICCTRCKLGRIANIELYAPANHPDLGGIRLHGGCENFLIENLTGESGEDMVVLGNDGSYEESAPVRKIWIRGIKANVNRCFMVNIFGRNGCRVQNVMIENLLDCSIPEQKKQPYANVRIGQSCDTDGECLIENITVQDATSRAIAVVEFGGKSRNVRISNIHGYGSCLLGLRCATSPEGYEYGLTGTAEQLSAAGLGYTACVKNWYVRGIFFRCLQASSYMRGTATSVITDKKKFVGTIAQLQRLQARDFVIEHVLADCIGAGFTLSGNADVEVRNFRAKEVGRSIATCGTNCNLTVNGQPTPVKATTSF